MCRKQRYRSASEASRNLRVLRNRKLRKDRGVHVYRCPECPNAYWHIGHRAA